jgi:cytochrome c oxidase subunit 2
MSLTPPPNDWFQPPTGNERTWLALAVAWCLVLFLAMPYWHLRGKQNSAGEAYAVTPAAFLETTNAFIASHAAGEYQGVPIAEPAPGGDAWLVAQMWRFWPVLKLKKDQTYRIHVSSLDLQHGFSLQPMNMNFHVLPGYDHVLTITPTQTGEFPIICNEFCGANHHQMTGRILVE